MKPVRRGLIFAALPALAMLLLFYSLAIHLHGALGAWPDSIGDRGFPRALIFHEYAAGYFFLALIFGLVCIVPMTLLSIVISKLSGPLPYFGIYILSNLLCFCLMALAPAPFLNWWLD